MQLWFASNMCQCLARIPLDLVRLDYMLLIMVHIAYHDISVGGAIVFDRVGQLSEFNVWQHLFCNLYQQIVF